MKLKIKPIFYSLIGIFILILLFFIIPFEDEVRRPLFLVAAILGLLFLALGITLAILARKEKGKLRIFLMLTGISAIAPLLFTILHNFFYALAIAFENLSFIFEPLHAVSFIISIIIAPIAFLVGIIGTLILWKRGAGK